MWQFLKSEPGTNQPEVYITNKAHSLCQGSMSKVDSYAGQVQMFPEELEFSNNALQLLPSETGRQTGLVISG